jgi:outer membrane autotransporter protein
VGNLHEQYFGYQFGFDLAKLNIGGAGGNLHVGLTAGYFESRSKDESPGSFETRSFGGGPPLTLFSPPGSFQAEVSVPFIGLYAAYTQGNFFIDGQVRQDFYLMNFTDPLNGLSSQSQNARGVSVGGNVGFKVPLPSNWFVEPSAGVMWSLVKVDTINTPGSALFQFLNAGSVSIDDIQSILGRVSLRFGTTFAAAGVVWQPFVTGSVFHEFADEATATSKIGGPENAASCAGFPDCPPSGFFLNSFRNQTLTTSSSRIGTYSQIGIGTAAVFGTSGWLAFGRADYKAGENMEGFNFNAGLRYHW